MFFWGSKGKTVSGQVVEGITCPSCEQQQFISFGILRYFHLYWIPTVVTSKQVGLECTHCKRTLIGDEIAPEVSNQLKSDIFTKQRILPMFAGLFLIACLVAFGAYALNKASVNEAAYIEQPAVNDLYIMNFSKLYDDFDSEYKYGVMRIKQISGTQVEFQVSKIAYNKAKGVRKDIRRDKVFADDYYDAEPMLVDISKLQEMKTTRAIYDVERP